MEDCGKLIQRREQSDKRDEKKTGEQGHVEDVERVKWRLERCDRRDEKEAEK